MGGWGCPPAWLGEPLSQGTVQLLEIPAQRGRVYRVLAGELRVVMGSAWRGEEAQALEVECNPVGTQSKSSGQIHSAWPEQGSSMGARGHTPSCMGHGHAVHSACGTHCQGMCEAKRMTENN